MVHSLYQSLNNLETIYADRIGIRYYDEAKGGVVEVPFRQYAADLRRFVAFLRSRTPNPLGQRVAILARNSYHYVMCMYGAVLAGAVAVPLNTGKNWDEIRYELDLVEPMCVLHDGEYMSREPALGQAYGDRLVPMDAFTAFEPAMDITEVPDLNAMAFIMFTSGTTGRSKGVMLSQKNLFTAMPAFLTPFEDVRSQTGWNTDAFSSLSCLPMFHISAMTSLVSWSITGHCVNLCNDLKYFYRDLGAMRSDVMAVVPVLLKSIYHDVMKGKRERLNGLRMLTCGAAMFDPAVLQDLMDRGFFIAQMYGLTETCGDGAWNSSQEEKYLTSVGHVDDSCQYKLEDGELCMRGDPVMLGYYKDPEATAEVLVPHRRHCPGGAGRLYVPDRTQKERDHPGQRRECEPRGAGKAAGSLRCHPGVQGLRAEPAHLCRGLLRGGPAGRCTGFCYQGEPHPAPVQAHGGGVLGPAPASQRCRQAAAVLNLSGKSRSHGGKVPTRRYGRETGIFEE